MRSFLRSLKVIVFTVGFVASAIFVMMSLHSQPSLGGPTARLPRSMFRTSMRRSMSTAAEGPLAKFKVSGGVNGEFTAKLYTDEMPITTSNFMDLAETGFYDGIHFHRVINNFMLQFGCPHAKDPKSPRAGTGGPNPGTKFQLYGDDAVITRDPRTGCIPDEFTSKISNKPGTLSMANTGQPNSGGSQFFVNTVHNSYLDWFDGSTPSRHPVFGEVVEGMDVVKEIEKTQTNNRDSPLDPVKLETIEIIKE